MSWRVARSLDVLLAEVNAAAPNRSKVADGSIGDTAHSSRASDHNPNTAGVVRARDFTHDPAGGLDCNDLVVALVPLFNVHPAMTSGAYVIWQGRIISADRRGEGWRAYTGSNPHDHHLHLSVATGASGYESTRAWGFERPAPVAPSPSELLRADLNAAVAATKAAAVKAVKRPRVAFQLRRALKALSKARKINREPK